MREGELHVSATAGRHRRTGAVGGQRRRLGAAEVPAPEAELRLKRIAGEPLALPCRVIAVLNRQRRERRCGPGRVCLIERGHVIDDDARRPSVEDDVVHRHQHGERELVELHGAEAKERTALEVERRRRFEVRPPLRLIGRGAAAVDVLQRHVQRRKDDLPRHAALHAEDRPQALVALHDVVEAALQQLQVERRLALAAEAKAFDDVVRRRLRLPAVEAPEPLLRERQWEAVASARTARNRRVVSLHLQPEPQTLRYFRR